MQRLNTDYCTIGKDNCVLRWQMDCLATDKFSVGAYVMYADGERCLDIDGMYDYLPATPGSMSSINTRTHRTEDTKTWAVNINAGQKLGKASVGYSFDYYNMNMRDGRHSLSYETFKGSSNGDVIENDSAAFDYRNRIDQNVDNYSAKVDVICGGIKAGGKFLYTRSSLNLAYSGTGSAYNSVSFTYNERVAAVYAEYNRAVGSKWALNIGGRYEHTWTKGRNRPKEYGNDSEYGRFFPSLSVDFVQNKAHSFNGSISSRITRPNIISLNPNRVWKDVNHLSFGNQSLKPSYMYKASVGYTFKSMLNVDIYYAYEPDRVDVLSGVDRQVTVSTWDNVTDGHSVGLNSFFCFDKVRWMTATLMQGVMYAKTVRPAKEVTQGIVRQNMYSRVENVSYTATMNTSFYFDRKRKWVAGINATYCSAQKDVAKKIEARYSVDAGVKYRFWNDKMNIALDCRNLLAANLKGTEYLGTTSMDFNNKFNYRKILLTVSYNWGVSNRHRQQRHESDEMQERMVNDF